MLFVFYRHLGVHLYCTALWNLSGITPVSRYHNQSGFYWSKWHWVACSGISWAIFKSAPRPKQMTMHASTTPISFYRPDTLPAAQPTASKHWRQTFRNTHDVKMWRHPQNRKYSNTTHRNAAKGGPSQDYWQHAQKFVKFCRVVLELCKRTDRPKNLHAYSVLIVILCTPEECVTPGSTTVLDHDFHLSRICANARAHTLLWVTRRSV